MEGLVVCVNLGKLNLTEPIFSFKIRLSNEIKILKSTINRAFAL